MNRDKLERLAEWLEAGAPHALFDMQYGYVSNTSDPDLFENLVPDSEPECGTVCCIAGAAFMLEGRTLTLREDNWEPVRDEALKILGLPNRGTYMGHELFDPSLAPQECRPQDAAKAVRRVMVGRKPWPEA